MRKFAYIIGICLVAIACQRRELTYNYSPSCEVVVETDWSNMDEEPSGMSIYCYPEDGSAAIIAQTNDITSGSVQLPAGTYNILVFNQIPSEYSYLTFEGLESFETAQIKSVLSSSKWSVSSKTDDDCVCDPEEVAAATYLDFVVSEEDVRTTVELKSKTKSDIPPLATLSLTPRVVTKTTRVRIRLSAIYNHRSTYATLYGMSTGYHFYNQKSHVEEVTHSLESWTVETYEDDPTEGEIYISFNCFGLPELTTSTRSSDAATYSRADAAAEDVESTRAYEDWDGRLDIEILLVDNATVISESIPLADKLVTTSSSTTLNDTDIDTDIDMDTDVDVDVDMDMDVDVNVDIDITWGFEEEETGSPLVLPDVTPEGSGGGFQASVDDWGNSEDVNIEI